MYRRTLLFSGLLVSACAPETGDRLIDHVASDVDPFADCLVIGQTIMLPAEDASAPAALVPDVFDAAPIRRAAAELARSPRVTPVPVLREVGQCGAPDEAPEWHTSIGRPQVAGDIAFVHYTAASGTIGVFAFRKQAGEWVEADHVLLGRW